MGKSLEKRFCDFLNSIPGCERIDELSLPVTKGQRKADYLLGHREVIVELKSLTRDTSHKIEPLVDRHRDRIEFPLFYGEADLRKVLAHLPDGEEIYRRIYLSTTRSVEDALRSAEEQISHTRVAMNLPRAPGVLIMLNENIDLLNPQVVAHRIAELMRRPRTGNSASERLDFSVLIFESHIVLDRNNANYPIVTIPGHRSETLYWLDTLLSDLLSRWARANEADLVQGIRLPDANFVSKPAASKETPTQMKRGELWAMQYRANPYLRALDDQSVLRIGAELMRKSQGVFLKGSRPPSRDEMLSFNEQLAHFFEEARYRALDLRQMTV
jgi:hypothetical protein